LQIANSIGLFFLPERESRRGEIIFHIWEGFIPQTALTGRMFTEKWMVHREKDL
jgi:hypothetical protein